MPSTTVAVEGFSVPVDVSGPDKGSVVVVLGAGGALVRVANPLVVDVGVAEPGSPEIVSVVDWEGPGATEVEEVEVEVVEGAVVCGRLSFS